MSYISTQQAGKRLGVTASRVGALIRAGRLKALRVGKTWVIDPKDLEAVKVRTPGRPTKKMIKAK